VTPVEVRRPTTGTTVTSRVLVVIRRHPAAASDGLYWPRWRSLYRASGAIRHSMRVIGASDGAVNVAADTKQPDPANIDPHPLASRTVEDLRSNLVCEHVERLLL